VSLSVYRSAYLSMSLPIDRSAYLSMSLATYRELADPEPAYLQECLSVHELANLQRAYRSVSLSIYRSVYLSTCPTSLPAYLPASLPAHLPARQGITSETRDNQRDKGQPARQRTTSKTRNCQRACLSTNLPIYRELADPEPACLQECLPVYELANL
jgi:hypothetical protein